MYFSKQPTLFQGGGGGGKFIAGYKKCSVLGLLATIVAVLGCSYFKGKLFFV